MKQPKVNAIVISDEGWRINKPKIGDKVYWWGIVEDTDKNEDKIAKCNGYINGKWQFFGLPVKNLKKIEYKPVKKFEYKVVNKNDYSESYLDEMGNEGWELVSILSLHWGQGYELTFKRELSSEYINNY